MLNSLVISNGGQVLNYSGFVGYNLSSSNNSVLVTGSGSVWKIGGALYIGRGAPNNALVITDSGLVVASNAFIGFNPGASGNHIDVSGGSLYVTNRLVGGELNVLGGTLTLNSGTVTVDSLVVTNNTNGKVSFSGGWLSTKATTVNNSSVFTVGNGTSVATLSMDAGGSGFHSFANGLTIASNATLRGNGTVIGPVTVNGGGTLTPGFSPGSIVFSNNLTLAPNSVFAVDINGNAFDQYDQITVLGTVSVSNSVLSISLGFTPSVGYYFTIVSNLGPSAVFGLFRDPQGDVLTNHATFEVNGYVFQINYDLDPSGQDVVLAVTGIPEPSTLSLVALGSAGLIGLRRRLRRGQVR
jgi:T5SS/PEP-CTERM-associated repeat protein